jgi:FMN phosphatase YigB (HAD superfamily)
VKTTFEHLVFDLDDTLLDTYRQLVPRASRDACRAMIASGLNTDLDACLHACLLREKNRLRSDLFQTLVERFGTRAGEDARAIAQAGHRAFYNREVETDIALFPGAREMLSELKSTYTLHLVTAGHRPTQSAKIRILELEGFFSSVHLVDPSVGQSKTDAFRRILESTGRAPDTHLSIGNRIDTDVAEARALGMKACWVRYGEYNHLQPSGSLERAEFVIDRIEELKKTCRL